MRQVQRYSIKSYTVSFIVRFRYSRTTARFLEGDGLLFYIKIRLTDKHKDRSVNHDPFRGVPGGKWRGYFSPCLAVARR